MASKQLNRVRVSSSTTGTGDIALDAATSTAFCTLAEAGGVNGAVYRYIVLEGNDFMIVSGTYDSGGPSLSVDEVHLSKIGGTAGTTQMNLAGAAIVRIIAATEDFDEILLAIEEANNNAIAFAAALGG